MKFDKIIFDFDGVILNSHNVKTQAFYDLFKKYGKEIAYKSKNYHLENTGISRFVKYLLNLTTIFLFLQVQPSYFPILNGIHLTVNLYRRISFFAS